MNPFFERRFWHSLRGVVTPVTRRWGMEGKEGEEEEGWEDREGEGGGSGRGEEAMNLLLCCRVPVEMCAFRTFTISPSHNWTRLLFVLDIDFFFYLALRSDHS
jgi:hypothetical protein